MLKSKNQPYLWAFIIANAVALLWVFFRFDFFGVNQLAASAKRGMPFAFVLVAPIVVTALNALLSASHKAALVFWRVKDPLPGHRAFSEIALRDPRIDMAALERRLGPLPVAPRDQNVAWYRIYKAHESHPVIADSQRLFLLMRDLAALAFLFALFAVAALPLTVNRTDLLVYIAGLAIAYLILRVAAMRHGRGLVSNVLALAATGKLDAQGEATKKVSRRKAVPDASPN